MQMRGCEKEILGHGAFSAASVPDYSLRNSTLAYAIYPNVDEELGLELRFRIRRGAMASGVAGGRGR